jgi:hypothetical protein
MGAPAWIDALYLSFAEALPEEQVEPTLELARTLGLAPSRDVPWSQVFAHEVTLAAPALVAEAMPSLPETLVREATLAHMLAVIEAFGTDRVEDGQVEATSQLASVLGRVRRARDAAMDRIGGRESPYAPAERETLAAIRTERALLGGGEPVDMDRYLAISSSKQRVGLPASLALARAAGWDARRVRSLARLLDDVCVALQAHDDVVDWEHDYGRGGAWAVALAAATIPTSGPVSERETVPVSMPRLVRASGVLARLLQVSARRFRAARRRAEALGAHRLARWARDQEADLGDLSRREADSPGFANRAHALSPWARTILE